MAAKWIARIVWLLFVAGLICFAAASYFRAEAAQTLLMVREAQLGNADIILGQREVMIRQCAAIVSEQEVRYSKCAMLRQCQ